MFRRILAWFKTTQSESNGPEENDSSGAHASDKEAPHYHHDRRAIKDQFTNHWDMDYMTREQLDELAEQHRKE